MSWIHSKLLVAMAIVLLATTAHAGRWKTHRIPIVDYSTEWAVADAAKGWEDVSLVSLPITVAPYTDKCSFQEGQISVCRGDYPTFTKGALTQTVSGGRRGYIFAAIIWLNTHSMYPGWLPPLNYQRWLIGHELGHAVALLREICPPDPLYDPQSIMCGLEVSHPSVQDGLYMNAEYGR